MARSLTSRAMMKVPGSTLTSMGPPSPACPPRPRLTTPAVPWDAWPRSSRIFPLRCGPRHQRPRNPYLSAALAAGLTLVGRPAIAGNVPLFGVTATAAGSGKGLLVDVICTLATGRSAPKMGQTLDDNEELKRLLALALEGASVCCIDNVTHPLGNQYLDMALTAQAITGRILGQTQTAEAPWNAVLFATGNNLSYRGDMTRRVVPIALDPKMEKPEERSGFRASRFGGLGAAGTSAPGHRCPHHLAGVLGRRPSLRKVSPLTAAFSPGLISCATRSSGWGKRTPAKGARTWRRRRMRPMNSWLPCSPPGKPAMPLTRKAHPKT